MDYIGQLFGGPWGPLLIFSLRIVDVSLSTTRILLSVRGHKRIVPFIGLAEVLVWLYAAGNAMRHLDSGWHVLGYATGFATGNMVGLWIEEKLALGYATLRVISRARRGGDSAPERSRQEAACPDLPAPAGGMALADSLRGLGYGATEFAARGREGPVEVVYVVVPRRDTQRVLAEVERFDRTAFVTVEQPREIRWGWFRQQQPAMSLNPLRFWLARGEK